MVQTMGLSLSTSGPKTGGIVWTASKNSTNNDLWHGGRQRKQIVCLNIILLHVFSSDELPMSRWCARSGGLLVCIVPAQILH